MKRGIVIIMWLAVNRAAVGMGIPGDSHKEIPVGMIMGWVWGLWSLPLCLWRFDEDFF